MTNDEALMAQALEALENLDSMQPSPNYYPEEHMQARESIAALRDRLEKKKGIYGCHCDLEPNQKPDGCVLDNDRAEDCVYAVALRRERKGRNDCAYWQQIKLEPK